ncbi:transposase [Streptomyces sp. NPDC058280]|uniref:transposase n=1 Tax=Streptomyces sp. NPDC058280 TaxID=3346419 RepID=UPI0036F0291F
MDEQWAVLEPLLPKGAKAGRPAVWPRRQLIERMRFRVRTAVPWRDVPVEYGPWGRICDLFRRWQRNGVWHRVLMQLQSVADAKGAITWDLSVDSTVCRAHQHAAGARKQGELQKEPPGGVSSEPKGCPVIPGGRTTTATAPRCVVGTPEYIQYADVPPPCDAPYLTPCADPPRITGQPLVITDWDAREADSPPSCTWPSSRARSLCRSS